MKEGEYLLLNESAAETDLFCREHQYLYRYLPIEFFLESMQKNQLTFINPRLWKDPFDNFLFKKVQEEQNDTSLLHSLYAMCLTLNAQSQAYWKNYADFSYSVRVRIDSRTLMNILNTMNRKVWVCRMKYYSEKTLIEMISSTQGLKKSLSISEPNETFMKIFLSKRKAFEYENEVRILVKSTPNKPGLRYFKKFKMEELYKGILLDPRIGDAETLALKEYLAQFNIPVSKSSLFQDKIIEII